jgi:cytochrome c oxidase subunit II
MRSEFSLFPEQASSIAARVDAVYFFLIAISAFFVVLIFTLVIYFAVKYRRRSEAERPRPIDTDLRLEILWTVIPLILTMISFAWGARLYVTMNEAPADAMEIRAVGRQWMWKFQHPEGNREINQLHVPLGTPIKMLLASEDVVHSFYVPVFRIKMDVVPGRYTAAWFEAIKEGEFHLFCAEYCGTQHSGMIGRVVVMKPADYQRWLSGSSGDEPPAVAGEALFKQHGCVSCHALQAGAMGPSLRGLFGSRVKLQSGQTIIADETYIRESILNPKAKIVAGYQPIMPTFQGQIGEEQLHQLLAYIKSLGGEPEVSKPR